MPLVFDDAAFAFFKPNVNSCPECGGKINIKSTNEALKDVPLGHCIIGICDGCRHLILTGVTLNPNVVDIRKLTREFYSEQYTEEDKKAIHDWHEEVHRRFGHWG